MAKAISSARLESTRRVLLDMFAVCVAGDKNDAPGWWMELNTGDVRRRKPIFIPSSGDVGRRSFPIQLSSRSRSGSTYPIGVKIPTFAPTPTAFFHFHAHIYTKPSTYRHTEDFFFAGSWKRSSIVSPLSRER